jgi:uncharacterized membrane protein
MIRTFPQPRSVNDYLRQLRAALEHAPAGLVQDALGDAEDYLREEVSLEPFTPESEVIARIGRVFGTPQQVAEEYLAVEARMQRRRGVTEPRKPIRSAPGFFGVASDWRTYGGLLYALIALPLGVLYFSWVVTGLALSVGLAILIIGVPFTLMFIFSVRLLALFEGRVVELLTGQRMPRRLATEAPVKGLWPRIKAMLTDIRTWTAMTYMVLQLPLGVLYFIIATVGLIVPAALVIGPLVEAVSGKNIIQFGGQPQLEAMMANPAIMLVLAVAGFFLFFLTLHILRAMTRAHGKYAEVVLVKL